MLYKKIIKATIRNSFRNLAKTYKNSRYTDKKYKFPLNK